MTHPRRPHWRHHPLASASLLALAAFAPTAHAQSAPATDAPAATAVLPLVEIVTTTPVPGTGVPLSLIHI